MRPIKSRNFYSRIYGHFSDSPQAGRRQGRSLTLVLYGAAHRGTPGGIKGRAPGSRAGIEARHTTPTPQATRSKGARAQGRPGGAGQGRPQQPRTTAAQRAAEQGTQAKAGHGQARSPGAWQQGRP